MGDVRGGQEEQIRALANLLLPTPVPDGTWLAVRASRYGDLLVSHTDPDSGFSANISAYGAQDVGPRTLVMSDFLGDSVEATRWTTTTANGGTAASSSGECLISTSANANGSAYITTVEKLRYIPGITYSFGADVRVGDIGLANNSRRWGIMTMSGTTPQDGYYFELSGTTLNAVSVKAGSATATSVGSWSRNSTSPFTLDTNYHKYEIVFTADHVMFMIDDVVRHILTNNVSTPRTATLIVPMTFQNTNASASATNETMAVRGTWIAKLGDTRDEELPHVVQNLIAQYTTTQTGAPLWTPATGKRVVVTSFQIQTGGTTAGTVQLWFGASGDTTYNRGTDKAVFDGEFAPSSTLKPGVVETSSIHGWKGNIDDILRVTDSAAINPITVNVWGYEE